MEITGDHILFICGRHMKQTGELLGNTVVATVMSNLGLFRALDDLGIASAKTAVGDKYVYEYMTKNNCRLGGEQSGHIIFSKYASTAALAHQHAPRVAQLFLRRANRFLHLRVRLRRLLVLYPHVNQLLRINRQVRSQLMQRFLRRAHDLHHLQARQDAVAG